MIGYAIKFGETHSLLLHAHATSSLLAFRGTYIYMGIF
jgi:hypothetical protein